MDAASVDSLISRLVAALEEHDYNHGAPSLISAARGLQTEASRILNGHVRSGDVTRHLSKGSASPALGVLREIRLELPDAG